MLSKQELYNAAMREISIKRQMARTIADEERAALEAAFPAVREAQQALQQAGVKAALAAATGAKTTQHTDAIAAAQQTLNAALAQTGRAPDALAAKFSCKLCSDTGLLEGNVCPCVRALMRSMRRAEIEESSALSITKFDTLNCDYYPNTRDAISGQSIRTYMKNTLLDLQAYAEEFDKRSSNLLLFGNSGLGKTHAALAVAGVVLEKGYDVIYISSPEFFSQLENYHFNNSPAEERALLEAVTDADLLILDDLGTEMISPFMISTFYNLLNNRTASHAPTIFTSNITDSATFEKCYTEKIASRLSGSCEPFHFVGNDVRPIKALEV